MAQLAYLIDAESDSPGASGGAPLAARSLSLFGSDTARLGRIADDARLAGLTVQAMRALSCLNEDAGGLLGDIVAVDAPLLSAAEMAALVRLDERVARAGAQLIVLTSEAALEDVFGCLERSHPQIVIGGKRRPAALIARAGLSW